MTARRDLMSDMGGLGGGCGGGCPGCSGWIWGLPLFPSLPPAPFSQGTGQSLAVMVSMPGSGTVLPGLGRLPCLAGLPAGTKPFCRQPRSIAAFSLGLGGHWAAPGSWVMGVDAAPRPICNTDVLLQCVGMWLSTGRGWGLMSGGVIPLCENLSGKQPLAMLSTSLLTLPSTHQIFFGNL